MKQFTATSFASSSPAWRQAQARRRSSARARGRRGVSSVLAMMFMVVFSSLAAVMAVVAQGNLRTAASGLQLSRAMSAAETGLVFAARRLSDQGSRFVVEKGVIDDDYAEELWLGTFDEGADGDVEVLAPTGFSEDTPPSGVIHAIRNAHLADAHDFIAETGDNGLPEIDAALGTLRVRPIHVSAEENSPYFRLRYELVDQEPLVRVTSQGVDGDITRTIQMDFRINKRIEFAVLSPNRIMIGKNVRVEGPLGTRFGIDDGELAGPNSHPLVKRSDFYYLDDTLSTKLDLFFTQLRAYDVDGDGRLRPDHPVEDDGLEGQALLTDHDGDEYVDDFDIFLAHYDANSDQMVVYDVDLASDAGLSVSTEEFSDVDDQLARLIDDYMPDRDGDDEVTATDTTLGYHDGVIDIHDMYAKVHGRLAFAVARDTWESTLSLDTYQQIVLGPIRTATSDEAPTKFEVGQDEMRDITTDMLDHTQTWFDNYTDSTTPFSTQVANNLAGGGVFIPADSTTWEPVPFGSEGAYDYYMRPVYRNMTFTNVRIPKATNALFEDCTFVGVTFVETEANCVHENWNYAGALLAETDAGPPVTTIYNEHYPGMQQPTLDGVAVANTKDESNNIRFHNCTFLGSLSGDRPLQYTHWRNKLQLTGTSRFYIDPADEDLLAQTDAAGLADLLNSIPAADRTEMAKSMMMLPGWSVDVGNFSNEVGVSPDLTPKIKLKGTIIAGILDVRGTADVHGTLLMTYRPVEGQGPLFYGGLPDAFNTTIGYFGPADGDGEGVDPGEADFSGFGEISLRYDPDALLPDGIPWSIIVEAQPLTYIEGGSM